MKRIAALFLLAATVFGASAVMADDDGNVASPRHITLREAVQLALKHNHDVRIAAYTVVEKQHAKM